MLTPQPGDVLIRDGVTGYFLVAAANQQHLSGPHGSLAEAFVSARRLAPNGRVWRENADDRGRALGRPFLLELQASALECTERFVGH